MSPIPFWEKVKRHIIFLFMISLGAVATLLAFDAVVFLITGALSDPDRSKGLRSNQGASERTAVILWAAP